MFAIDSNGVNIDRTINFGFEQEIDNILDIRQKADLVPYRKSQSHWVFLNM